MADYFVELWQVLWTRPLYRGLMIAIAVEIVLVCSLIVWLWVQSARQLAKDRAKQRFLDDLEEAFFEALGDPKALRGWMQRAAGYPREFARDFIARYLLQTRGQSHDTLIELYHEFGYVADDHQQARSVSERKRIEAMRRLYVVATEADRSVLLEHADDDYLSRILAAQTLARVGKPEDIVAMLKGLELRTQLMEEPVHAVLGELSRESLRYVFTRWKQFESGRLRRVLLITAAEEGLEEVASTLGNAAQSDDMEVRIGACIAAARLPERDTLSILIDALEDPDWQVRAQAAKGLGHRREVAAIGPLAEALKDRAFWVRQDAALALRQLGERGRQRLEEVAENSDDRYAAESASQELQRYRLLSQMRGAPA